MKNVIITFLVLAGLSYNALAEPAFSSVQSNPDFDTAQLSSKVGNSMFAYYQFNFHDQLVAVATLRYCGAEDRARKIIDTIPDFSSFYHKQSSQQLVWDMVYKEAIIGGYDLQDEKDFELVSRQSLISGQSYFSDYLKNYQLAMQEIFQDKVMELFCQTAIHAADTYLQEEVSVP